MPTSQKPCRIGDPVDDIDTPALVVCLKQLEDNLSRMRKAMTKHPSIALRPHIKTHKCSDIARMQVAAGAVGVCCQTVTEAEAAVGGGILDVFVSNQVIGKNKLRRLASIAKQATVSFAADDAANLQDASDIAIEMGAILHVAVEINMGQFRCGAEPGEMAVPLAKLASTLPGLTFKGIHCYNGWNQHIRSVEERREAVGRVVEMARQTIEALRAAGMECNYVTGGGTGTFHFEAESGVFTEVQPGSYVMMDADYFRNLDKDGKIDSEFVQSLYIISTVQSASADGERAVLDAGLKAVSLDSGEPLLRDYPDMAYHNGGDNHGIVTPRGDLKVGSKVWLVPGHCDPTVNLYDWIVGVRNGIVESIWPISGRGPGN